MRENWKKIAAILIFGLASLLTMSSGHSEQVINKTTNIKTRLDHFRGTDYVLVISYLPEEITSITCEEWVMLGVKSWNDQNNFTIPSGPAVAVMNSHKFNGYCKTLGSIVAHTDDGDYLGVLDAGPGNWTASTKLTFTGVQK